MAVSKSTKKTITKKAVSAVAAKPSRGRTVGKKSKAKKKGEKALDWFKKPSKVTREDVESVIQMGAGKADEMLGAATQWVARAARQAKALYDMLVAWYRGKFDFPASTVGAITVALLYFLSPFDLIPDFLPMIGLADDAAVLAFVISRVQKDLKRYGKKFGVKDVDLGLG